MFMSDHRSTPFTFAHAVGTLYCSIVLVLALVQGTSSYSIDIHKLAQRTIADGRSQPHRVHENMTRPSDPRRAQEILTYDFQNVDLLREALQAPGLGAIVGGIVVPDGNKRLSLLGISVIETSIKLACYQGGSSREQFSTQTQLCTAPARLAQLTQQTTLDMCVVTNPSQRNDELPASLLADTLKAVLAAVWIDCGFDLNVWTPVAAALGYPHHQSTLLGSVR